MRRLRDTMDLQESCHVVVLHNGRITECLRKSLAPVYQSTIEAFGLANAQEITSLTVVEEYLRNFVDDDGQMAICLKR